MSNGVLCFAHNNGKIDYLKQAISLAKRVKKHLNLPTTVVTSTPNDLTKTDKKISSLRERKKQVELLKDRRSKNE